MQAFRMCISSLSVVPVGKVQVNGSGQHKVGSGEAGSMKEVFKLY